MKNLEETVDRNGSILDNSAEGVCGNSQAKGPDLDDTLESEVTPTKQIHGSKLCNMEESFR